MATRRLELTILSARDLSNSTTISGTYAVVWISSNPENRQQTPMDRQNGSNPTWGKSMVFTLHEAALQQGSLFLEMRVFTHDNTEISGVRVRLRELLFINTTAAFMGFAIKLWKRSGEHKGLIELNVKFAENAKGVPPHHSRSPPPSNWGGNRQYPPPSQYSGYPSQWGSYGGYPQGYPTFVAAPQQPYLLTRLMRQLESSMFSAAIQCVISGDFPDFDFGFEF